MAGSSSHFCTLCQEDDISNQAVRWCFECNDWLCTDCEKHHGRSKSSKQHKTVAVEAHDALPPSILEMSNICSEHDERFERFCSFHGAPCCIECVRETHKECELSPLTDILKHVKESPFVSNLERDLNEIKENFEVIERHLLDKIANIADQKQGCLMKINRIRSSLNDHLDAIERNIIDELSQTEKNITDMTESLAREIETKKRRVENLQNNLTIIKQHATDLHIFQSIKEIEKQTNEASTYLEDFEKRNIMADISLSLEVSPALESLQREVTAFGKVTVNKVVSTLKLSRTSHGHAQLLLPIVLTVNKIKLVQQLTIKVPGRPPPIITACAILDSGECVFADYNNYRLLLYDKKGAYIRDVVKTSSYAHDMCHINDNIVGICFADEKKIEIVDVGKSKLLKSIKLESRCYGIDHDDRKLFVRLPKENAVVILNLEGKIEHRIGIPGEYGTRIAFYKNYIFCTNWKESEVLCYDIDGKLIWKHKNETLIYPLSIAINKKMGIIYVAGYTSGNIAAISLNGDQSKIVLSQKDGLNEVWSIHIGAENKLLICNKVNELALIYQL